MLPPFGVTGRPEAVIGASARVPAVIVADEIVIDRSPALAKAVIVPVTPLENTNAVPFGIAYANGSTGIVVPVVVVLQVTMNLPVIRQTIREVEAVPVSRKIATASTELPVTEVNVVSAASATPLVTVGEVRFTFAPTSATSKSS